MIIHQVLKGMQKLKNKLKGNVFDWTSIQFYLKNLEVEN